MQQNYGTGAVQHHKSQYSTTDLLGAKLDCPRVQHAPRQRCQPLLQHLQQCLQVGAGGRRWGVGAAAGGQAGRRGGSLPQRAVNAITHPLNTRHPAAAPTWMNCSISYGGNGTWAGSLCTCSKQRGAAAQQAKLNTPV